MVTTLGSVATTSIVCKGWRHAVFIQGDCASAGGPGQAFAKTAVNNVMTIATTAHHLVNLYFLEFRHRTSSTFGEQDIDVDLPTTTDERFLDPIASGDDIEWWIQCIDLSADKFAGTPFIGYSDGILNIATQATMSSANIVARVAANYRYVNGDKVCKVQKP